MMRPPQWARFTSIASYNYDSGITTPGPRTQADIKIWGSKDQFGHRMTGNGLFYTSNTYVTPIGNPKWLENGGANSYQANARFFNKSTGGTLVGSAANTWIDCGADPWWGIYTSSADVFIRFWLQLREKESLKLISNVYCQCEAWYEYLGCPDPNMRITLADGSFCRAGDLKVGMNVLAIHEKTKELGSYPIRAIQNQQAIRFRIRFEDGKEITCSDMHRFYLEDGETLIRACKLSVGMRLGNSVITAIDYVGAGEVVSFEVEEAHTYFMEGVLSHNFK